MKKIKSKIIRLLGGRTNEDINYALLLGGISALNSIHLKMKEQYGKDADEWCKELYSFVVKLIERYYTTFNKYNH